ncbi:MAG: inorganic diphosphatase [Erysipelotrichaceae bacterium]
MNRLVEALIEIPMGSQNKYEVNKKTNKIKLDRVLYSPTFYPAEYGYIENTLALDNDPMDILVFTTYPTFPGCYVEARIIGGMDMIDSGEVDIKVIAVCNNDPRYDHVNSLDDIAPHILKEVEYFFNTYKSLQGSSTAVLGWLDINTTLRMLDESSERYIEHKLRFPEDN